jgi:hypothetical protein
MNFAYGFAEKENTNWITVQFESQRSGTKMHRLQVENGGTP